MHAVKRRLLVSVPPSSMRQCAHTDVLHNACLATVNINKQHVPSPAANVNIFSPFFFSQPD
jgi:hypothetical protein